MGDFSILLLLLRAGACLQHTHTHATTPVTYPIVCQLIRCVVMDGWRTTKRRVWFNHQRTQLTLSRHRKRAQRMVIG
uniref:Putative secreted protein n=1 Tax=Anopheles marajoara TaxID=58244 RepID=A0A2M4CCV8_9DIPT